MMVQAVPQSYVKRSEHAETDLDQWFIVGFLVIILIDGLPSTRLYHDRLKAAVDRRSALGLGFIWCCITP
jgi:hypothetical protein